MKTPADYAKHKEEQGRDRPKEFAVSSALSTAEYVRAWCLKNSLVHNVPREKKERRK